MCRFTGPNDIEYKKVTAALQRMTKIVSTQARREEVPLLNKEQRQILVDSLRFDQIDARQMSIKSAHTKTCEWLLKKTEYLDWLDAAKLHEHHGFLWIKGKPGTGKSTIMKFALANSRRTMKDIIIISFFFNARGADLEKSTIGMYRSLLLQLLERVSELQCVFDSLGFATWNSSGYHQWSVELLKDLFQHAIQKLGKFSVACFIDALDECEEHQIRDMITFLQQLGELSVSAGIRFHICFSSRHYPHITINKGLSLVLEGQEGHIQDITNYINSELKIGHSKLAEQIRVELQEKASGVFMWVVLVVDILNKEHDGGRIHVLRKRLRDIPSDLHKLFRDILTRDHHNRSELLLCIQWLLFARQPLKPEQLYFAILSGIQSEDLSKWDSEEITIDIMKRFILNSSKGLAEITRSKAPSVQFIHESVRDFLLKENGLRELWSDLGSNFQGHSHEQLRQCCLNYMSIDIAADLNIDKPLPKAFSEEAVALRQLAEESFPFLEYAAQNVLYHADAAEKGGVNQKYFLQNFQLANWIKLNNLFERHEIRRHRVNVSLLYILAEGNLPSLIKVYPDNSAYFKVEDERYGPPIFAALATNSAEAARTILEALAEIQPPTSPLHSLRKQYCQDGHKWAGFGRDFSFSRRRDIPSYLAEHGNEIVLSFFIETEEYMPDTRDKGGRTSLSWAAQNGHDAVVKQLLDKGAEQDSKDKEGRTPLSWAAAKGNVEVTMLLLEKGAEPDSKDKEGRTPLSWAAAKENVEVTMLLLEKGAESDSKDKQGWTPLSWVAANGNVEVTMLLLEKGAESDSKDKQGRTPLWWAAANGQVEVTTLLFKKGAELDSKDKKGRTPLSWAAAKGNVEVTTLLLEKGAAPDSKDNEGRTPLSWAARYGLVMIEKLLTSMTTNTHSTNCPRPRPPP